MRNYFKKFSIVVAMSLMLVFGCSVTTFASDDGVVGTANLNNTVENSAKVGDILKNPEKGWKRFNQSNLNLKFNGKWVLRGPASEYGGDFVETSTINDAVKFNFIGSKMRIITPLWGNHSKTIDVFIDGIKYNNLDQASYGNKYVSLGYEVLNLKNIEHSVVITNKTSGWCSIDALDIDENGQLKPYNEQIISILLDKSTMNLTDGDSGQLTATTTPTSVGVTWTVSDPSIATIEVDPTNGKITKVNALKEGTCTITATTADGSNLSASCILNVIKKDVPKPDNPTTDTKTVAILIINLTDGETKVFDVSSSEVDKFKSWYNTKSEFENKLTYVFNKTVNSNISVEEDVVHNQITSFEIRKY